TRMNRSIVTEKIATKYMAENFDETFADVAVLIAGKMQSEDNNNKAIESYFRKALKRKMVGFEQLVILVNGLKANQYSSRWDVSSVRKRMIGQFIKDQMATISIDEIIELAVKGLSA